MSEKKRVCLICGSPSEVSICDSCKASVQGEAVHKRQKIEKEVRVGLDKSKDRKNEE